MKKKLFTGILCALFCLLFLNGAGAAPPIPTVDRFVTPLGAGNRDGTCWNDAWGASQLPGVFNAETPQHYNVRFQEGTYDIPIAIIGPSGALTLQFFGGYPQGATGTSLAGRNPSTQPTILRPQNDNTHVLYFRSADALVDGITIAGHDGGPVAVQQPPVKIACSSSNAVKFNNVIFRDGWYSSPAGDTLGGAVLISTASGGCPTIDFTNCSFIDNKTESQFAFRAAGGAVAIVGGGNSSKVTFTGCTFSGNIANANSGSGSALGGAIFAETPPGGGPVDLTILSSRLDTNSATAASDAKGGALYIRQGAANKRMAAFIGGSVFTANTLSGPASEGGALCAELDGGGGYGGSSMGRCEVVASTFFGNGAGGGGGRGGAARLSGVNGTPHIDFVSCTIAGNSAAAGSGVDVNVALSSWAGNIIAGNTGAVFNFVGGNRSYGYNLVESASSSIFSASADVTGALPSTIFASWPATLNANGTVSLLSGGTADGAVAGQGIPEASYPGFFGVISPATLKAYRYKDQTGAIRPAPAGSNLDIGAYELNGTPPPPPAVITPATSVALVPTNVTMDSGDTLPLVATVLPGAASNYVVVWDSTNASVATVSGSGPSAVMTAVSPGVADIVVSVVNQDNSVVSSICSVAVSGDVPVPPNGFVPVTGITLPYSSLTFEVGDARMIAATVLPTNATSRDVTWSVTPSGIVAITPNNAVLRDRTCTTSSPQVLAASSRNITITAIGAGNAVITATTVDGGFTASCALTVTSAGIPVPASGDATVGTNPAVDDKLGNGGDVSVSPGVGLPAIRLPGYFIIDDISDPDDVTTGPADPTGLPPCTRSLGYTGTELGVDVSGINAGGDIVLLPVTATIPLSRARLQEVLNLVALRTGRTHKVDDVIAAPQNYLEDLFTVLLIQQQIKEGPDAGTYVWLTPGVIEPRAAYDYKLLLLSSVSGNGITLTFRYYMADDIKGVRFVQGNLIVGDGQKNGRILDPLWGNVRAPASTSGGSTTKVDGGSGCNAGFFALALPLLGALAAAGRRFRKR